MNSLLVYEALGLRDFFTAVLAASGLASVLTRASGFGLASPAAFFAGAGAGRAPLGFASPASPTGAGSGFSSAAAGRGASFFTFFAGASSSADGAGAAAGCSPLAITSPLYTQHLMPMTP